MAFDIRINGDIAMLVLSGDVDLQTTSDMKNDIIDIIGITQLDIDASDVTYIDSSGIAVLLLARQHCLQNNITINFTAASSAIYRVLQMAKLDTILPIAKIVDHAEDTGALGIGGGGVFSAPPAKDSPILQDDDDDDDPLIQALLQESEKNTDDDVINHQSPNPQSPNPQSPNPQSPNPQSPNPQSPNPDVALAHTMASEASETGTTPFGEAVSDEALASALLADVKDHEDDLKANMEPGENLSGDKPNPAGQGDISEMSTIKPGNFNWE